MNSQLFFSFILILSSIAFSESIRLSAKIGSDDKVKISVYYESLCPDSKRFINGQLSRAFNEIPSIMNVELIPFGKAIYRKDNNTGLWNFACQHGNDECYGNTLHNCYISQTPKFEDHFKFLNCCMSNLTVTTLGIAKECADALKIKMIPIVDCANSATGNELLYQSGVKTHSLDPALFWVPWININDVHTNETQYEAERVDLVELICRTYKGSQKPKACNSVQIISNYILLLLMVSASLLNLKFKF